MQGENEALYKEPLSVEPQDLSVPLYQEYSNFGSEPEY